MSGYYNYSMSNNAVAAYSSGEKPFSKWTKSEIINSLIYEEIDTTKIEMIKNAPATSVKKLLTLTSWHHTSSYYNKTDFYSVDIAFIQDSTIEQLTEFLKPEIKKEPTERKAECKYLEWSGTRKHPKATEYVSVGMIKGNWFYLPTGSKKSINANGFRIIRYID